MKLINIFCILLLVRVFPSTIGDIRTDPGVGVAKNNWLRKNIQEIRRPVVSAEDQLNEGWFGTDIVRLRITYIYEINKHTKLTLSDVKRKIEDATEKLRYVMVTGKFHYEFKVIKVYIERILPFYNPGKPLANYNAAELSRFLNNDVHFRKLSKNTDNTQIVAFGDLSTNEYPEELSHSWNFDPVETKKIPKVENESEENDFYIPTEKVKTNTKKKKFVRKNSKQNRPVAVTTFKDICSKKSRGIIVDREGSALNIAKLLSMNFGCAAGVYDKRACLRGFRENDIKSLDCVSPPKIMYSEPELCLILEMWRPYNTFPKTNHVCETNRQIHHRPSTKKSSMHMEDDLSTKGERDEEDNELDGESGSTKIVYILLAASGAFLSLATLVGICLWIDRNKTKKLTKDRVSVNYKYDPMKRTDRPSIITDPTVTNDLE